LAPSIATASASPAVGASPTGLIRQQSIVTSPALGLWSAVNVVDSAVSSVSPARGPTLATPMSHQPVDVCVMQWTSPPPVVPADTFTIDVMANRPAGIG